VIDFARYQLTWTLTRQFQTQLGWLPCISRKDVMSGCLNAFSPTLASTTRLIMSCTGCGLDTQLSSALRGSRLCTRELLQGYPTTACLFCANIRNMTEEAQNDMLSISQKNMSCSSILLKAVESSPTCSRPREPLVVTDRRQVLAKATLLLEVQMVEFPSQGNTKAFDWAVSQIKEAFCRRYTRPEYHFTQSKHTVRHWNDGLFGFVVIG